MSALRKEWLFVPDVMVITGWSVDHTIRHLERLYNAGSPHVIDSSLVHAPDKKPRRRLQISREGLDLLLASMRGSARKSPRGEHATAAALAGGAQEVV